MQGEHAKKDKKWLIAEIDSYLSEVYAVVDKRPEEAKLRISLLGNILSYFLNENEAMQNDV